MAKKWLGTPPKNCDICGGKILRVFVDGRTRSGPWGFLCMACHANHGCGLGTGYGQKYELINGEWFKTGG